MGSNEQETRPVEAGDPLAAEARREVRRRRIPLPAAWVGAAMADNFFALAACMSRASGEMARASAAMAAKDDTGVMGGAI